MYLPDYILRVISVLENSGYEAYCVGGCVRDYLLGRCPDDYDITTSALPEQIIAAFDGYKLLTIGLKHGTVTVIIDGILIEITTYRIDGEYKDHRHPEFVEFTSRLEEDLSRRDFTINAMAYNPKTGVVDLFGGRDDLAKGIVRAVGIPFRRFDEDGLRILRALRFASRYGFCIEEQTALAAHKLKHLLNNISAERIQCEINQIILGECGKLLIEFSDIICTIIPEMTECVGFEQHSKYHDKTVYGHTVAAVSAAEPVLEYRLTMLLHDIGKPECFFTENGVGHFYGHAKSSRRIAENVLKRLKYSNRLTDEVLFLIEYHGIVMENNYKYIRRAVARYGEERFFKLLKIHIFDNCGKAPDYIKECELFRQIEETAREYISSLPCLTPKELCVKGGDVIKQGYSGAETGRALKFLLDAVIDEKCENKSEALIEYLNKNYISTAEERN